jgi:hypothetical protein
LSDGFEVEPHVLWLLDQLPGSLTRALGSESWEAQISLVLSIQSRAPAVFLSKNTLQRLADLGVNFDVDVYVGDDLSSVPSDPSELRDRTPEH